ncbi:MAG: hypothetical protein M0R80_16300 [Proteobacteria bacterium]|jgi:hypothetical protein|nr:hypothetical protein [Pseudomonadota bacterium]
METRTIIGLLLGAAICAAVDPAAAEEDDAGPATIVEDDDELDHFELTMGFIAGARRYDGESFAHEKGGGGVAGVKALVEPFGQAPYDDCTVFGLRYDLRLVVSHVRMTAGVDFPFASFEPADTRRSYDVAGVEREIAVQKIRPYELRFGIGGEIAIGRFAPFVDLIGEVDWVSTELVVDGETVGYGACSFGFSARVGARLYVREWFFVAAAGEIGIVGQRFWGAELSLGFSFG